MSLAHHVIAGWFLKCRLPLRKNFVKYILNGFMTNVQKPFEEVVKRTDFSAVNEDSSNRKRSSSLTETERGAKNRERPPIRSLNINKNDETTDETVYNFHMELAETCIDFLARHTFSSCSALPKRLPTTDFLLDGGQTVSWLVGHNIVTITTSGCSLVSVRNGLCDRCSLLCKTTQSQKTDVLSPPNGSTSPEIISSKTSDSELSSQNKRYTKASLQHNNGQDSESTELTSSNSSSATATPYPQANDQKGKLFRQPSNEGRFSNSSGSLEALSRRGSNPDTSADNSTTHPPYISPQQSTDRSKQLCACLCSGWAEIVIRRPTGNMSWIMRIQNQLSVDSLSSEIPLQDIISMVMPPSLGIYNSPDTLIESSTLHSSNNSIVEQIIAEPVKKKLINIELTDTKQIDELAKKQRNRQELFNNESGDTDAEKNNSNTSSFLSGPIDIPNSTHKYKIPSGSFSDAEPDLEDDENTDVTCDESDTRSRNPVRRVNSSPEMSSNWRHPYLNQKTAIGITPAMVTNTIHVSTTDDDPNVTDVEQQQKKKNFCKDMRVSCEAIPEEIADSTPPNQSETHIKHSKDALQLNKTSARNNQLEFIAKLNLSTAQNPCVSLPTSRGSSIILSDTLLPVNHNIAIPKKQHSADDALQQKSEQTSSTSTVPTTSSSTSNVKVKLSIDMPKLTTKPPQSHAPLSPRLLPKASGLASHLNSTGSNNSNDLPRGRSKTISVMRGEHDNRDSAKWAFKGCKLNDQ